MKISEVTVHDIKQWGVIETDDDNRIIQEFIMPAAKSHLLSHTGIPERELDLHEDLTLAYMALCAFLFDNRSMAVLNDKSNAVIQSFLDGHCRDLVR